MSWENKLLPGRGRRAGLQAGELPPNCCRCRGGRSPAAAGEGITRRAGGSALCWAPCPDCGLLAEGQESCRFSCCLSHVARAGAGGVSPAPSPAWGWSLIGYGSQHCVAGAVGDVQVTSTAHPLGCAPIAGRWTRLLRAQSQELFSGRILFWRGRAGPFPWLTELSHAGAGLAFGTRRLWDGAHRRVLVCAGGWG